MNFEDILSASCKLPCHHGSSHKSCCPACFHATLCLSACARLVCDSVPRLCSDVSCVGWESIDLRSPLDLGLMRRAPLRLRNGAPVCHAPASPQRGAIWLAYRSLDSWMWNPHRRECFVASSSLPWSEERPSKAEAARRTERVGRSDEEERPRRVEQ